MIYMEELSQEKQQKIREIVTKIAKAYQPEKIILFGSYAWGRPNQDSDLDFFIIKKTDEPTPKRIEDVDKIFLRREFPMDFLVYTPEQVVKREKMNDRFVINIIENGKTLYAR
ncbi:MAG: DNA polymerase beta domain-containing protein [Candidatus Berkelbacteria bacterium Licking1014_96]|uniref:DNA polymerase beta domain-containing protein n=1 Tax=Candidatus Berkelbacteria bacterium Licking1014_96 TaxID=2017149 RepID=A0A554LCW6_9BACT|nr:MAG: DNA polymerase beta domain-containing protein [Candidatus Berkelbacteria bacterium Licking1014_96]